MRLVHRVLRAIRWNARSLSLVLTAAAAFVMLCACGETKKLNKTYANTTPPGRYLWVKYKIYGGGSLAQYIPATCFTGTNAPPTPGGCPTAHVSGNGEGTWIMNWDLGPTPGARVHVGCDFVKVGTGSTATYPIDLEELGWGFQATAPTAGSHARQYTGISEVPLASPVHPELFAPTLLSGNPALVVNVSLNDRRTVAVIAVSSTAHGTVWLQNLQLAASSMDVPINNVMWGDPLFESLPWQIPTGGSLPAAIVYGRTQIYYLPVTSMDLSQMFAYVRYQASLTSPSSPPDQQSGVQYPMP